MIVLKDNRHKMETSADRNVISLLETVDIFTGERTLLREFDELIEAPQFMPDGDGLVYNSMGLIYRYDFDNKKSYPINSYYCDHCNNDHVLSSDGSLVAVSHHTYEDGLSRIYSLDITGSDEPKLITPIAPSYLHGWSSDGELLAYCAERCGDYDIYTISAKGGVETRLTYGMGLNDGPEFSPDGKYIYFNSVRSGLMQLYRMDTDGQNQTRISEEESNNWFPHISPDNKYIAYLAYKKDDVNPSEHPANKDVEIRIMEREGESKVLVSLYGGQGTINVNSWSPDSTKLAFVSYRPKT